MEWIIALALCLGSTPAQLVMEKKPLTPPTCDEIFLFWCRDTDRNIFFPHPDMEASQDPSFSVEPDPSGSGGTGSGSGGSGGRGADNLGTGTGSQPSLDRPGKSESAPGIEKDRPGNSGSAQGHDKS